MPNVHVLFRAARLLDIGSPHVAPGVPGAAFGQRGLRPTPRPAALARRVRLSGLQQPKGLGSGSQATDRGMRRMSALDQTTSAPRTARSTRSAMSSTGRGRLICCRRTGHSVRKATSGFSKARLGLIAFPQTRCWIVPGVIGAGRLSAFSVSACKRPAKRNGKLPATLPSRPTQAFLIGAWQTSSQRGAP